MAHAQHTPAPWRLNAGNETLVMGSNQRPIARAECGGTAGIKLAEAEANARLIAAAPDLLAALQYAAQFLADEVEQRGLAGSDMTDYQDEAAQALDRVEAAIAKATGQDVP